MIITLVNEKEYFNSFVQDMKVEDIPIVGRRFKWYRLNGRFKRYEG